MAQRNVSERDIAFILCYGQKLHRAGAIVFYLRQRDIPPDKQADEDYARLEGTAVVTNRHFSRILTVYRNRQSGLRHIKQKSRRSHQTP
jgi:hypothetical protein